MSFSSSRKDVFKVWKGTRTSTGLEPFFSSPTHLLPVFVTCGDLTFSEVFHCGIPICWRQSNRFRQMTRTFWTFWPNEDEGLFHTNLSRIYHNVLKFSRSLCCPQVKFYLSTYLFCKPFSPWAYYCIFVPFEWWYLWWSELELVFYSLAYRVTVVAT